MVTRIHSFRVSQVFFRDGHRNGIVVVPEVGETVIWIKIPVLETSLPSHGFRGSGCIRAIGIIHIKFAHTVNGCFRGYPSEQL